MVLKDHQLFKLKPSNQSLLVKMSWHKHNQVINLFFYLIGTGKTGTFTIGAL